MKTKSTTTATTSEQKTRKAKVVGSIAAPVLKLFVWSNPYHVSYGSSLVFVIAENLESAKALACSRAARWYTYNEFEQDQREWPNELGEPLRIVDLPCAEWHEWSE